MSAGLCRAHRAARQPVRLAHRIDSGDYVDCDGALSGARVRLGAHGRGEACGAATASSGEAMPPQETLRSLRDLA